MPGAKIIVQGGTTLTLTNMDIFTCGSTLAQGIIVETGGTLLATSCTFNDSRFAINALPGSTISLVGNGFFDNYIGVNLDMAGAPAGTNRVNILAFGDNSFSTAQVALNTPFPGMSEQVESRGYCGIYLNNYQDFNVWGGNTFTRLANGIVGTNSIGNLGNMTFSDMNSVDATPKYNFEGFGIRLVSKGTHWFNINEFWTSMSFTNCKTGIYASNYALNVENTTMTAVGVGIDVSKSKMRDVVIDGNTITARRTGIRSGLNEPLHPISAIKNNVLTITGLGTLTDNSAIGIQLEEIGLGYTPLPVYSLQQRCPGYSIQKNKAS